MTFQLIADIVELLWKEILITIIGGIVTGISAMLLYTWKKEVEYNSNKYSSTSILYEEIIRNARRYESHEPITNIQIRKKSPTDKVYHGLLFTGTIKYFNSNLQSDLEELYDQFEMSYDVYLDSKLLKRVYRRLEEMKCHSKRYRFGLHKILCRKNVTLDVRIN